MSFVFAEKNKSLTTIYSDTKVTFDEQSKLNWGENTRNAMSAYGIIKTIIVRDNCCISFAGNDIRLAHKLFQEIADLGGFSEDQLLNCALKIHLAAQPDDIEFIICTADDNDETHIICIKEGNLFRDCINAWIGSGIAFLKMQELRMHELNEGRQPNTAGLFGQALLECKDESVGIFEITTIFSQVQHSFFYTERLQMTSERKQIVLPGKAVKFHGSAEEGAYTVYQHWSSEEVRLDIAQADLSILFSRKYRLDAFDTNNPDTKYFLLPIPFRTSTGTVVNTRKLPLL